VVQAHYLKLSQEQFGENDIHAVFGEMKVSNSFDVEQFFR